MRKIFQPDFLSRFLCLLLAYSVILYASLFLALFVRFEFLVPEPFQRIFLLNSWWIVALNLFWLFMFGQFKAMLSYFRLPDLYRIFLALATSNAILVWIWAMLPQGGMIPRSVIMANFIFSFTFICGFRGLLRVYYERYRSKLQNVSGKVRRVAIVGAGDMGATIAADLLAHRGYGMRPIVFLDDDGKKRYRNIHGISVVDIPNNLKSIISRHRIESIVIAMPSASPKRIAEIVQLARSLDIDAEMVPSLEQLTTGKVKANRIRPVEIQDLLGRELVDLESDLISDMICQRTVMVTGAGGSIGSELCRQICSYNPTRLLMVEQSEVQLFEVEQALNNDGLGSVILPLIADVLDEVRMRKIFERYKPDIVFHAAAHKHVFMMERQPAEAVKNNSFASAKLADLAAEYQVDRFILVSTDKAINPTSVMGATKRLAEIYIQAKQTSNETKSKFIAVRFGNVLGSSGSVVPIFKKQIAHGGPVKVTHPDVTRYFMTISEAVGLVLQSATQGEGGEIFVLDMGTPTKIADLAKQMIELSGFKPDLDIDIEYIGLKPGEKLFEELQHTNEAHAPTKHSRIFRFLGESDDLGHIREQFKIIGDRLDDQNIGEVKARIKSMVPEYTPFMEN